ncbi:hypothetical protein U1Q18_033894 [Sarracenia purpurea var. burkii]
MSPRESAFATSVQICEVHHHFGARSLHSLRLCDNHLGQNFAKMVFRTLFDAASGISVLDLSENNGDPQAAPSYLQE